MQDIAASSNFHENIGNSLTPTLYRISTLHCTAQPSRLLMKDRDWARYGASRKPCKNWPRLDLETSRSR
jgi:hypothetical protein